MTIIYVVALVGLALAFVLFLGGMLSAAYEIHRERKAGVPVERPAYAEARGFIKGLRGKP